MLQGTDLPGLFTTRSRSGKALPKDNPSFFNFVSFGCEFENEQTQEIWGYFVGQ